MKTTRRNFLQSAALSAAAMGLTPAVARAASPKSFARQSKMKLGTVTYNLGKDWDIETLIRNCEAAQFEGVELRTTHAHKVEVNLTKTQRAEVRKRFEEIGRAHV